jgi:hypothetical protein
MMGLAGVAVGIYAYARVQWQRDYAKSWGYSVLNLVNGLLLEMSLLHDWNMASFIGNALWIGISFYGLYRCWKYARRRPAPLVSANDAAPAPEALPAQRSVV